MESSSLWSKEEIELNDRVYQKVMSSLWGDSDKTNAEVSAMTMSEYSQWRKAGRQYLSVAYKEEPVTRVPQTRISRMYGSEISSYELYRERYIAEGWLEDLYRMVDCVTESE